MAFQGISYDLTPYTRELDELSRIYYVDSLIAELNTDSNNVTPRVVFESTNATFTAINTAARAETEVTIDRLGPITELKLEYTQFINVKLYGVQLFIRPVDLNVSILPGGEQVNYRGRASDPTTSLVWDLQPFSLPKDARVQNPLIERLYVDIVTGAQTVTPVLVFTDGTTSSLAGITNATRAVTEFAIGTTNRLRRVRLDGDFTNSAIILYDVSLDLNIPRVHLG